LILIYIGTPLAMMFDFNGSAAQQSASNQVHLELSKKGATATSQETQDKHFANLKPSSSIIDSQQQPSLMAGWWSFHRQSI
jgi:hypothetical protein